MSTVFALTDCVMGLSVLSMGVGAVMLVLLWRSRRRLHETVQGKQAAEESLRHREEELRTLTETVNDLVVRLKPDGTILSISPNVRRLFGYDPSELVGLSSRVLVHPDDLERLAAEQARLGRGEGPIVAVHRYLARDGSWTWLESSTSVAPSPSGEGVEIISISREVGQRVAAEKALRASEERYRLLAENSTDLLTRIDLAGTLLFMSPACQPILGYQPAEIVGRNMAEIFPPDEVERVAKAVADAVGTTYLHVLRHRVRRSDGGVIWLETNFRYVPADGSGMPEGMLGVSRDITERIAMEQMRSDLVTMLSHDLKNPLGVILGYTELLREELRDDPARLELVDHLDANTRAAISLAMNFVDGVRVEAGVLVAHPQLCLLDEIVEHCLRHQESVARLRGVRFERDLGAAGAPLPLDKPLADRAVANLVSNALKFSPKSGVVTVRTERRDGAVYLTVRDRGPGVPPHEQAQLFGRFSHLTNGRRDSTGLGLFIVRTIAEAHGGDVRYESPPEGGAAFVLRLPEGPQHVGVEETYLPNL